MRGSRTAAWGAALLILLAATARAAVKLPAHFDAHMVLQRDMPIHVWGWADPGENVAVRLDAGDSVSTTANRAGEWRLQLPAQPAGGPCRMVVQGQNEIVLDDVWIGDVWLCSGQSNMQWPVSRASHAKQEIANANHPRLRHFRVPQRPAPAPQRDTQGAWTVCSPKTVGGYTAVGYFFGRMLLEELDIPVGLINASWGGTRIDPWTPPEGWAAVAALADIAQQVRAADPSTTAYREAAGAYVEAVDAWRATATAAIEAGRRIPIAPAFPNALRPLTGQGQPPHQQPTVLYNGMIHPLAGLSLRGAIWYQGEANREDGRLYTDKMEALVGGWRAVWGIGDFPFYYVQIAPYQYGQDDPGMLPLFWEAQTDALRIPHTGMVVINDIGNTKDIHPANKQQVGRRLALQALAHTYGRKDVVWSGPVFQSLQRDGTNLVVRFDHVGDGLCTRDGKAPDWFEIRGAETEYVTAQARIADDRVVLSAAAVTNPVAVRFAWHKTAEPNLMNRNGLPARPFRAE